jgi:ATP-dependent helicase/DNAse subunit B
VESSTFGDLVHKTFEELYTPFVGNNCEVSTRDIDNMLKIYERIVSKHFKEKFSTSPEVFERGAMYFALLAAKKQVRRFLEFEKVQLLKSPEKKLVILSLECELEKHIPIHYKSEIKTIRIAGKIDRIDQFGEQIRIIDYKTGNCDQSQVTISGERYNELCRALENVEEYEFDEAKMKDLDQGYILQLLFYLVLYTHGKAKMPDLVGILSMRNLKEGIQNLNHAAKLKKGEERIFEALHPNLPRYAERYITHLAERIFKLESFQHNTKAKYCLNCI